MSGNRGTYQERRVKVAKLVQFAVYCWAMRLGIGAIGTVLVSLFQFMVPTEQGLLRFQNLHVRQWGDVVNEQYNNMRDPTEPVLFVGVGAISSALLRSRFEKVTPVKSTVFKESSTPDYLYFDEERLWSKQYRNDRNYAYFGATSNHFDGKALLLAFLPQSGTMHLAVQDASVCADTAGDSARTCAAGLQYVYATSSNALSYLPALSPGFAQYVSLEESTPQVCMWFSSENVTAGLHFDLDDNFLLQISGEKTVTIVSPEAVGLLNPHSSWHPLWRQGYNVTGLRSAREVLAHLGWHLLRKGNITSSAHDTSRSNTTVSSTAFGEVKVWYATLKAGDAIFIPAGYYHTVTAVTGSISVNAWFHSQFSDLYSQLENCPLPFLAHEDTTVKTVHVATMLHTALALLDVPVLDYASVARRRYEVLLSAAPTIEETSVRDRRLCAGTAASPPSPGTGLLRERNCHSVRCNMVALPVLYRGGGGGSMCAHIGI
jgi:dTDP-4-dehydrorhamnose 3,5-epimerase-like enzyme